MNKLLPYIPKNTITELNNLIYACAKFKVEKSGERKTTNKTWMRTKAGNPLEKEKLEKNKKQKKER